VHESKDNISSNVGDQETNMWIQHV
jgi:hypothetical protein